MTEVPSKLACPVHSPSCSACAPRCGSCGDLFGRFEWFWYVSVVWRDLLIDSNSHHRRPPARLASPPQSTRYWCPGHALPKTHHLHRPCHLARLQRMWGPSSRHVPHREARLAPSRTRLAMRTMKQTFAMIVSPIDTDPSPRPSSSVPYGSPPPPPPPPLQPPPLPSQSGRGERRAA